MSETPSGTVPAEVIAEPETEEPSSLATGPGAEQEAKAIVEQWWHGPTERVENVARILVAALLLGTLLIIVLFPWMTLWFKVGKLTEPDIKDLAAVMLAPIVGLVGAAAGYYFGKQQR